MNSVDTVPSSNSRSPSTVFVVLRNGEGHRCVKRYTKTLRRVISPSQVKGTGM